MPCSKNGDVTDTICTLIKEKPEFKSMSPSEFLGRIQAHENVLKEKDFLRESGSRLGRHSTALKAMTSGGEGDSSSSYSDDESDSEESLSTNLALMIKSFDHIHRNSLHANYKKRRSKPLTKSERTCH